MVMLFHRSLLVAAYLATFASAAFIISPTRSRVVHVVSSSPPRTRIPLHQALTTPAVAEGERTILEDGPNGPILVTRVAGNYYAVDATCPHLGLPMKKGKIEGTTITCNFHNSCFDLATGECKQWVTGALGMKVGFIGNIMSKVGSEKKDLKAYTVTENEDGTLTIE